MLGTCNQELGDEGGGTLFRVGNGEVTRPDPSSPSGWKCHGERSDALRVYRDGRCATPRAALSRQAHCSRTRPHHPAHPPPPPPPRSLLVAKGAAKEADGFVNVGAKIEELQKHDAKRRKMLHTQAKQIAEQAEHIAEQAAQIEHMQERLQAIAEHLHHRD